MPSQILHQFTKLLRACNDVGCYDCRSPNVTLSNMAFVNCTVDAALIRISNCGPRDESITMRNPEFRSNINGSGIIISSTCRLEVKNGIFWGHSSTNPVIQMLNGAEVTLKNSLFEDNHGPTQGGIVSVQGSNLTLHDCNFTNNIAGLGGALFLNVSCLSQMRAVTSQCRMTEF